MSIYWIFGSSKSLGSELCKFLAREHDVVCFSRTIHPEWPDTIQVDFRDLNDTQSVIRHNFVCHPPDGVIFCQRYRRSSGKETLAAIKEGLDVELGPVLSVLGVIEEQQCKRRSLSVVLISSTAGIAAHTDTEFYYSILKSVTVAATRTLAVKLSSSGVRINCLVLGEFLKYAKSEYTLSEQEKFLELERFSFSRRMCNISDISGVVGFLLSENSKYITGELFCLDGGMSKYSAESIVRSYVYNLTS
jgi:NAD(P)-dependent dehydrogenase (short-subunit alcohol dehydrogenase family)